MKGLQQALAYQFSDTFLLQTALTHRSHSAPHNERLEFIGDGVLNCAVAALLYQRFPQLPEGDLSRLRANLVRKETLHEIALELKLGDKIRLGEGELKSGGHQRPSILADTLEALFGGVFLDGGFDAAAALIGRLFAPRLETLTPGGQSIKDAKTRLQEYLQGKRQPLPKYSLISTQGEAHAQQFRVECEVASLRIKGEGAGGSRRAAEQEAAARVLEILHA